MKVCYKILALLAAALLLVSCSGSSQVEGNGKIVTKTRQVSSFDEIKISGSFKVQITQGTQNIVKVTTDSNIEPDVITKVSDDTLNIHNRGGVSFKTQNPVLVQIVVKKLTHLSASGENNVTVSNLTGDELEVDTSGAIQANFTGKVDQLSMEISGSGTINATKLVCDSVKVNLTGSGQVMVNATDKLDSKITGSGNIMYTGNPKNIDQSIVGSGKLQQIKK